MRAVLDASALLAYLRGEPGGTRVRDQLLEGAVMSAVNLAEVASKLADWGQDPAQWLDRLRSRGLFGQALQVLPFTQEDALLVARLRPLTRPLGLSLGDRACLALASRLHLPALTADATWAGLSVGVAVEVIR